LIKHELKYCPECNDTFECKVGSIALCQCADIVLTDAERDYIREKYDDCLCARCMKKQKAQYRNELFQTRLKAILGIFYKNNTEKK